MELISVKLGDLVASGEAIIKTGPFGTQLKAAEYVDYGTPVINVKNIGFGEVVRNKLDMVGQATLERLETHILRAGDIVFGRKGAVERHAYISEAEAGWMQGSDCIRLRIDSERVNSHYLSYYFLTPKHKAFMIGMCSHGTTMASLNQKILEQIEIPIPDTRIQNKIVSILKTIDDRIGLNSKINDNLQQQAQAIYASMFITNADPAWTQGLLSDLITVKYGKDHKKLADGMYPVFGSGGIMRYVERPLYTGESVLIPRKGTLNNVMYVNEPFWSVDTMFFTEMKIPNVAKFVFHFVKAKDLASMNAGSAVQSMTTDILNALELTIPSADRLAEFESAVAPIYQMMQVNRRESAKLAELRDMLLPKLMAGTVNVSSIQI